MEIGPPELNLIIQEVEDSTIVIIGECHLGIDHDIFFYFHYLTILCFQSVKIMKLVFNLINLIEKKMSCKILI